MVEIHCLISGKVQGVAYRTYAQDAATALEVVGYISNLSDGRVEIVAQGDPSTLKDFVEYLHEGSLLAQVEAVAVEWHSVKKVYDDFSIKFD